MKTWKRTLALILAAVLVFGCLAACGKPSGGETPNPGSSQQPGGDPTPVETPQPGAEYEEWINICLSTHDLDSADPYGSTTSMGQFLTNLTFDTVTYVDADTGEIMPELAHSWKDVSAAGNGGSWEFYLQDNVYFHNGNKLCAEDVKFTWEYAGVGQGNVIKPLSAWDYVESIEVVDDLTVRFNLKNPMPDFASYLETKIYSKAAFDSMPAAEAGVIGTGPYYFDAENTKSGVQFTATRYDKYWRGIESYPTLHICFKVVPDADTQVAGLQAGTLDIVEIRSSAYNTVISDDNLDLAMRSGAQSWYMGFNYGREIWQNVELRRAICQAISREDIVNIAWDGGVGGVASNNFCVPTGLGYTEIEGISYDPDAAKATLEKLGYGDGMEITIYFYDIAKKIAEVIQANLAQVGVKVNLHQADGSNWGSIKAAQEGYDIFIDYCAYQGALLYNFNRFFYTGGSSNVNGYYSADYEKLQNNVQAASTWDEMLKEFAVLQDYVGDNVPLFPIGYSTVLYAIRKDVKGLVLAPSTNYVDVSTVFIPARK